MGLRFLHVRHSHQWTGEILIKHPALIEGYYKSLRDWRSITEEDGCWKRRATRWSRQRGFWRSPEGWKLFKTAKENMAPMPIEMKLPWIRQRCWWWDMHCPTIGINLSEAGRVKSKQEITDSMQETLVAIVPLDFLWNWKKRDHGENGRCK